MSALLLLAALAGDAQAREEVAILRSDSAAAYDEPVERLQAGLTLKSTVHDLRGEREVSDRVIERLQEDPPRAVVALGPKAAYAAKNGLPDVPMVYLMVPDPDRYGVPGAKVTGVAQEVPAADALAQFILFAPEVERIGVIISQDSAASTEAAEAAAAADIELKLLRVGSGRDVRPAFRGMRDQVDALWLLPDPEVVTPETFRYLREESRRLRMPLFANSETLVRVGALMCVAPDYGVVADQAVELTNAIIAGESPHRLPVEPPAASRVVLSRATMAAIDHQVDEMMLDFADEVIEEGGRGR